MPDGRFVSKSVAHDLELNSVSFHADYLFTRMVPHLDCEGRLPGSPRQVKAIACPMRNEITVEDVDRCLRELADVDLILWYMVDGRPIIAFPAFDRHQKGLRKDREADSVLPSPQVNTAQDITGTVLSNSGAGPEDSGLGPRKLSKAKSSEDTSSSLRSSDGASPGVENPVEAEEETAGATYAPLVRKHLWQDNDPPPKAPDGWSMGREINTAKRLEDQGFDRDELAGAIGLYDGPACTLAAFYKRGNRGGLNELAGKWRKREESRTPSIGDILAEAS